MLDDVPQRDDVEAARRVVLIEDAALADADPVVRRSPFGRASGSARIPRPPSRAATAAATKAPAAVPMSSSRPRAAGEALDLDQRGRERALARRQLRDVGRVLALGVAGQDQIAAQARVDVLQPAPPALDQPIDQQLVAGGAELLDEIEVLLLVVPRLVDGLAVVGAAERAGDVFEELFVRRAHHITL